MEQITLHVQGMSCVNCVKSVEESVGELSGVQSVQVKLDHGTVHIEFDQAKQSIDTIKSTIEDQGYQVASS